MQSFCFSFFASVSFVFTIMQCYHSDFYLRFEKMFLVKKDLSIKKMGKHFFWIINIEHLLVSVFFVSALFYTHFDTMTLFFLMLYQSTSLLRKFLPYYTLAWWLDRWTVLFAIVFTTCHGEFNFLKIIDWQRCLVFSFCFFLIILATYFLKQISIYGQTLGQRLQNLFKRS